MDTSCKIAKTIKELMDAHGFTSESFADVLGWSCTDLERVLSGELMLTPAEIEVIAKVFGMTKAEVLHLSRVSRGAVKIHRLKLDKKWYWDSERGDKNFEVRKDDRHFAVGDVLELAEFDAERGQYTGECHWKTITYVLRDFEGLAEGYVCLGVTPIECTESAMNVELI